MPTIETVEEKKKFRVEVRFNSEQRAACFLHAVLKHRRMMASNCYVSWDGKTVIFNLHNFKALTDGENEEEVVNLINHILDISE